LAIILSSSKPTKPKKSRSKRQREANSEFLVDFGKLTLPTLKRYKRSVDTNYDQSGFLNKIKFNPEIFFQTK